MADYNTWVKNVPKIAALWSNRNNGKTPQYKQR